MEASTPQFASVVSLLEHLAGVRPLEQWWPLEQENLLRSLSPQEVQVFTVENPNPGRKRYAGIAQTRSAEVNRLPPSRSLQCHTGQELVDLVICS